MHLVRRNKSFPFKWLLVFGFFWPSGVVYANAAKVTPERANSIIQEVQQELLVKPGDMQLSFALGMAYQSIKKYDTAARIFRGMLRVDPYAARPRLELAYSLFALEQYDEALFHFKHLKATKLPIEVKLSVKRFIDQIRLTKPSFNYEISLISNDNPNKTTSSDDIMMRGLRYSLSADAQKQTVKGVKTVFDAHIPLNTDRHFFTDVGVEHNEYNLKSMNLTSVHTVFGHKKKLGDSLLTSKLGFMGAEYGKAPLYHGHFLSMASITPISGKANLIMSLSAQKLKYADEYVGYDVTSKNYEVGIENSSDVTWHQIIKAGYLKYPAQYRFNAFDESYASALISKEFSGGWRAWTEFLMQNKKFYGEDPLFGLTRKDRVNNWVLGLANTDLNLRGWTPKILFTNSLGRSNIELHRYKQNTISLTFGKVF